MSEIRSQGASFRPQPRAFQIARSLNMRDRDILLTLYEHKLLLTEHLKALFFRSTRRAQSSLKQLADLGLIHTSRPPIPAGLGRSQGHHTLTPLGIAIVAALKQVAPSSLRDPGDDDLDDVYLDHRLGIAAFFCALIEASQDHDGHCLLLWKPERVVRTADGWIRPDGFGRYAHPGGVCDLYLEYDRGTETTRQLAAKLAGFIGVARDWTEEGAASFPTLLFVVPSPAREHAVTSALERALARFKKSPKLAALPFFVTSERHLAASGVLGQIWRPLGPGSPRRLSIVELPSQAGFQFASSDCLGRKWNDEARVQRLYPRARAPRFPAGAPPEPDSNKREGPGPREAEA
jgi:Replication-relaxation